MPVVDEREPTPFPYTSSSDCVDNLPSPYNRPLSPVSLPDEDYMATSQSSHSSIMTLEDMDSEELAGTRESTPVADVSQIQGIHRMESIVALGPVGSTGKSKMNLRWRLPAPTLGSIVLTTHSVSTSCPCRPFPFPGAQAGMGSCPSAPPHDGAGDAGSSI